MMIHANSLSAYHQEIANLSKREQSVMLALEALGTATDRQVMNALQLPEPNCVRPRITSLLQRHLIEECGIVTDDVTRKTVRLLRIRHPEPVQQDLFA